MSIEDQHPKKTIKKLNELLEKTEDKIISNTKKDKPKKIDPKIDTVEIEKNTRRKRGRPKGSSNKNVGFRKKDQKEIEKAAKVLWERGLVHWKLDKAQMRMYNSYKNRVSDQLIWVVTRQAIGKSYCAAVIAIEDCINNPNHRIAYVSPQKAQTRDVVEKNILIILEDCPDNIRPKYDSQKGLWKFPNGSIIKVAGIDGGHIDNLRGQSFDLIMIDEAGFPSASDFNYAMEDVLYPMMTRADNPLMIMFTTPPKTYDHPFNDYWDKARDTQDYIFMTIYDSCLSPARVAKIENKYGKDSIAFKREFMCVDENTDIKTKNGYKPIKDIEVGEEVFTHKGRYKPVKDVFRNPLGKRKVYEITCSNSMKHIVTEGHELYVEKTKKHKPEIMDKGEWIKVEEYLDKKVTDRIYFKNPIDKTSNNTEVEDDFIFLAGWYCAEGWSSKTTQAFGLSLNKKDPIDKINQAVINLIGKPMKMEQDYDQHSNFGIYSKYLKERLSEFGRVGLDKKIPSWVFGLSDRQKRIFLNAYIDGDGYTKEGSITVTSISKDLILGVSDLLLSIGCGNSIRYAKKEGYKSTFQNKRDIYCRKSYGLEICGKNLQIFKEETPNTYSYHFVEGDYFYSQITKVREIEYDKEIVYDLEIEDDHSYVSTHATFHNCEKIADTNSLVIPEATNEKMADIIGDWIEPEFCQKYVVADYGVMDNNAFLFCYYDFMNGKVVIQDELILSGAEYDTALMAEEVRKKEVELWGKDGVLTLEPQRYCDNNLQIIRDFANLHNLMFLATAKDNKQAAINDVRVRLQGDMIVINPKCVNLINHIQNATWDKNRMKFKQGLDHHYDTLDCLIYLIRNIDYQKNPFPSGYFLKGSFISPKYNNREKTQFEQSMEKLFTPKKRGRR